MKRDEWFDYPEPLQAETPNQTIQVLLNSNFMNLAILSGFTGLAILLDSMLGRSTSLLGVWPAVVTTLVLAVVVWIIRGQKNRWPILTQRVLLLVFVWVLSGSTLTTVFPALNGDESLMLFLLVLTATAAFTIRPLLDQLLGLLIPILAALFVLGHKMPYFRMGRYLLMAAFAGIFAFTLARLQLRQKMSAIETFSLASAQRRQLDELTQRDPITELYNDSAFRSRLSIELARALRYNRPLSLIAFDLYVNNHPLRSTGRNHFELTIASLAVILNKKMRTTDILGCDREGRFLVALPDTDLKHAQIAANRIQVTIQNYNAENNTGMTFCCGISEHHGETIEALVLVTEARMREALRLGSDQIVVE